MVRPQGPSLRQLGIVHARLSDLDKLPHHTALAWRYERWLEANNLDPFDAVPPPAF
jgi:hypothetical protein